jgi:hypothetical protein
MAFIAPFRFPFPKTIRERQVNRPFVSRRMNLANEQHEECSLGSEGDADKKPAIPLRMGTQSLKGEIYAVPFLYLFQR